MSFKACQIAQAKHSFHVVTVRFNDEVVLAGIHVAADAPAVSPWATKSTFLATTGTIMPYPIPPPTCGYRSQALRPPTIPNP